MDEVGIILLCWMVREDVSVRVTLQHRSEEHWDIWVTCIISPSDSPGVQRRDQSPCSAPVGGDSLLSRSVQQRAKKASLHASAASSGARPGLTSPSPGGHKARF